MRGRKIQARSQSQHGRGASFSSRYVHNPSRITNKFPPELCNASGDGDPVADIGGFKDRNDILKAEIPSGELILGAGGYVLRAHLL